MTSKRTTRLWTLAAVLIAVILLCVINNVYNTRSSDIVDNEILSTIESDRALCEQKIIIDFQLVEPEFIWSENRGGDKLYWTVKFFEWNDVYDSADFSCTVTANQTDARIERNIDQAWYEEDVIYDNREEGVETTRG